MKLLISIDGSQISTHALQWACKSVVSSEDELHLVTVLPPMAYRYVIVTRNEMKSHA